MRGRALLRSGQVAEADRLVSGGLEPGADDALWCVAGEVRFRRGDFDAARQAFQVAADAHPANARAWWGLGRIEQLHFNRASARDLFAKAYRLDPSDTDIILSFLDFVDNAENRRILLRNVAALSRESMPERASRAMARLQVESQLAGRPAGALASGYTSYRLSLGGFHPAGATRYGLIVTARINGGRPLRLVLDTGARGILLHKSAAAGLELERVAESQVGGFGGNGASDSVLTLARSVAFDELKFSDCLVEVSAHDVAAGADGIVGASLFERFRVRIDAGSRSLELTPESGERARDAEVVGGRSAVAGADEVARRAGRMVSAGYRRGVYRGRAAPGFGDASARGTGRIGGRAGGGGRVPGRASGSAGRWTRAGGGGARGFGPGGDQSAGRRRDLGYFRIFDAEPVAADDRFPVGASADWGWPVGCEVPPGFGTIEQ